MGLMGFSEADGVSETLLHEFASRDVDALFEAVSWRQMFGSISLLVVFVGVGLSGVWLAD